MSRAVVSAGDSQTAQSGARVLDAGGNAMDALCAAAFASWVVEPPLSGPTGAGLMVFGSPGHTEVLDFFTRVPGRGLPPADMASLDFEAVTVDYGPTSQDFHVGRGAAALPTAAWGLVDAHALHGRLPLSEVIQPALQLARDGWVISPHVATMTGMLAPILTMTSGVRELHCKNGTLPEPNAAMRNPGLATFFEALAHSGRAFLEGPLSDALVRDFGPGNGGRLTRQDLEGIALTRRAPLSTAFCGHTVHTPSPPATGGTLVALSLALAETLEVSKLAWLSGPWCDAVARIMRAVSIARARDFDPYLFEPGAAERLLNAPHVENWAALAAAEERHLGSTTHISVMDADGHVAAMTMSNGEGCGHAIAEFGIHVNNFLGEEDINPTGFHTQPAGSAMTTMMTPTVITGPDGPVLVAGSGGANRIRSAVFLAVLARIGHGSTLDQAANAPRLHVEGDKLWFEGAGLHPDASALLASGWDDCTRFDSPSMFFGGVNLAGIEDGAVSGAGDRRRGGTHHSV